MKRSPHYTYLPDRLWMLFLADIALLIFLSDLPLTASNVVWLLLTVVALILGLVMLTVILSIKHRYYFSNWPVWLVLSTIFFVTTVGMLNYDVESIKFIGMLNMLMLICSGISLMIAICIKLFQHDIGLKFIGWSLLTVVWGAMIVASTRKQFLEELLKVFKQLPLAPYLAWLGLLYSVMLCLVPIAIVSVVCHTWIIVRREFKRIPPPSKPSSNR